MKYLVHLAAIFIVGIDALVALPPLSSRTQCCFGLNAVSGSLSDPVGQISDGQCRVFGFLQPASFCIDSGQITDANGRGCLLVGPDNDYQQFQCDFGKSPEPGFTINCDGTLSINNNQVFWECPTDDQGENNIYTTPPSGQQGCFKMKLNADNCRPSCSPSPTECTAQLNGDSESGNWQFPHLIIPVSSTSPYTAAGTSFDSTVNSTTSTIFNFDIPPSYSGKTCALTFLLPNHADLETSSYTLSGGALDFSLLLTSADSSTTWDNCPGMAIDYGVSTVQPGGSYTIATFLCQANERIGFKISSVGDTSLLFMQDYNPSAIGLYIITC